MSDKLLSFISVPSAYDASVISNQSEFTFISNKSGIPQAWILDDEMEPVLYGDYPDRVLGVHHSPQGNKSIIKIDKDGDEKQQFYLQNGTSDKIEPIVYSPNHFHKFGGWSPNGEKICFSSNRRNPGYFDVFILDLQTKEIIKVFEFDGICEPICWTSDGQSIVISIDQTNIENTLYILDLNTKELKNIGDKQALATYSDIQLTDDNKGAYILTNLNEDTMYLGYFSLNESEKITNIYHIPNWDIEILKLSPDESKLSFTVNEGGISKLVIFDLVKKTPKYIEEIPYGVIDSLSWKNNEEVIFSLKSPTIPGDIFKYHLDNNEVERLTNISEKKEIKNEWIYPELCSFESFDEVEIPYFIYQKDKTKNKPTVIFVHGGPESQTRAVYNPVVQYLAEKGFAVITPNVRGSKGYGRKYIKMDDGRKRMDAVKDLVWLTKDLVHSHKVDKDKIGIMGRSYGGFMVLAAMTHFPEVWAAGVNIVGISNFKSFLENTGAWRRQLRESEYGSLEHDSDFFEKIAPIHRAKYINAPLLVFHGKNDTRVPISEAEQLVYGMKDRKQTVEFIVFDNEGHHTENMENIITMHKKTIEFFEQYLIE